MYNILIQSNLYVTKTNLHVSLYELLPTWQKSTVSQTTKMRPKSIVSLRFQVFPGGKAISRKNYVYNSETKKYHVNLMFQIFQVKKHYFAKLNTPI